MQQVRFYKYATELIREYLLNEKGFEALLQTLFIKINN